MSEIFLVPLIHPDAAPRVLEAASRMAECVHSARIDVLAVTIPPETMIIPSDEAISTAHLDALIEQEAARAARLKAAFERWSPLATSSISTSWAQLEGLPADLLPTHAQGADLVVIERPRRPVDQAQRQTTDAAIFGSHRPVLVVPPGAASDELPAFGRRIAIAWKDDGRAVKAVIPALRYFERAEQIAVIAGYREGTPPPETLPEPLAERGLGAKMHPLKIGREAFGQTLLDKAKAIGADLLVMGAYTHSPLRELLLGGVTRHVLTHAEIPVLMRH